MTDVIEGIPLPPAVDDGRPAPDPPAFLIMASPSFAPWTTDGGWYRVQIGAAGQVLTVDPGGNFPQWANASSGFSNPMTTLGDIITGGSGGAPQRLGIGTAGFVLTVSGGVPIWAAVFQSPLTTTGDLIFSNPGSTPVRLGIGTAGQVLTVSGGLPSWQNSAAGFSNPMTTTGDLISSNPGSTPVRIGVGTTNQVLTVVGGVPAWANSASGFGNPMTTTGDMIYSNPGSTPVRLGIGSQGNVLTANGGIPAWLPPAASPGVVITPSGDTTGVTDQANITFAWSGGGVSNGGVVYLAPGTFYVKPASGLNCLVPPAQTVSGNSGGSPVCIQGAGPATIIKPIGAGVTCIYYHRTVSYSGSQITTFDPPAGYLRDFTIDGSSATGASTGIDTGDGWGYDVRNVRIQNFTGTGAIGFAQVNRIFWTEKCHYQVDLFNCSTHGTIDIIGGSASHEYNRYEFRMFTNTNQQGIVINNGSNVTHGPLHIGGNMALTSATSGAPTNNVAALSLLNGSTVNAEEIVMKVEGNTAIGSGTILPYGLFADTSAGQYFRHCHGLLQHTITNSNINGIEFEFQGLIADDPSLTQLFPTPGKTTSTSQPAVPATGVNFVNSATNMMVYVTAGGGGATTVIVGGGPSVTVAASATLPFFVNSGSQISLTYTSAPTWAWMPAATAAYG